MNWFLGDVPAPGAVATVQVGPAWWQTLLIALGGGALTLVGTVTVGLFDRRSRRNAEWFRRVQWAQRLTASNDAITQTAGFRALTYLNGSALATRDDKSLLEQLAMYPALERDAAADPVTVDETLYVLDNEGDGKAGVDHDEDD